MRLPMTFAIVVVATSLGSTALAGVIEGRLWLTPRAAGSGDAAPPDARRQRGVGDAVIYLERVPEKVEYGLTHHGFWIFRRADRPRILTLVQRHGFEPRVAAVPVGTRIAFLNLDRVYHNVFSVSPAKRFDLGKYAPGASDTVDFERPGLVNLHCDVHPDELGFVMVTPNHALARPDTLGRYRLPSLPPGNYTVHVYHPRRGEFTRKAEVPKRGDLHLDLGD